MNDSKLCFISYARNSNLDGRLGRFVDKLRKQVPGYLPNGIKPEDVAFFDVQSIDTGDDWMLRLAEATRHCKVCVCFYALPYFTSEYSGREVQVFLQRVKAWEQNATNAGQQAGAIIPVIWVPHSPLPAVLQRFQLSNARLPAAYAAEGLLALAMRKGRADAYNAVLSAISAEIAAAAAKEPLPAGDPIASFGAIASAFHTVPTPQRYGASVIVLAESARRSRPFVAGGPSIDSMLETLANRCKIPFREIGLGPRTGDDVLTSIAAREVPLLVTDRASLESTLNAGLLGKISGALNESATVVVFGDPLPNAIDVATSLRDLALQKLGSASVLANRIAIATDTASFQAEVERRILKARGELITADPSTKATDAALRTQAEARGITVDTQPVLTGPGG